MQNTNAIVDIEVIEDTHISVRFEWAPTPTPTPTARLFPPPHANSSSTHPAACRKLQAVQLSPNVPMPSGV